MANKHTVSRSLFKDTEGMQMVFCLGKSVGTLCCGVVLFDSQYGMLNAKTEYMCIPSMDGFHTHEISGPFHIPQNILPLG